MKLKQLAPYHVKRDRLNNTQFGGMTQILTPSPSQVSGLLHFQSEWLVVGYVVHHSLYKRIPPKTLSIFHQRWMLNVQRYYPHPTRFQLSIDHLQGVSIFFIKNMNV